MRMLDSKILFLFLSLICRHPVSETRPLVFCSSFIDWNATCEGQFPSVYCPLELNDYNAFPEGKAAWTVPVTSFYSQKVKAERMCVLRALAAEKVPLRVIFQLSAEPLCGCSTLAFVILYGLKKPARPSGLGTCTNDPALCSPSDSVEQGLLDLCEPEWSQSVGGLGLYLLVTLLRQASPKRGRMIHVLVPQHVLTLIPLDSAAEGRESARRGN